MVTLFKRSIYSDMFLVFIIFVATTKLNSAELLEWPLKKDNSNYYIKFETSAGEFIVCVHKDWAPSSSKRFVELVKIGYYDKCKLNSRQVSP